MIDAGNNISLPTRSSSLSAPTAYSPMPKSAFPYPIYCVYGRPIIGWTETVGKFINEQSTVMRVQERLRQSEAHAVRMDEMIVGWQFVHDAILQQVNGRVHTSPRRGCRYRAFPSAGCDRPGEINIISLRFSGSRSIRSVTPIMSLVCSSIC